LTILVTKTSVYKQNILILQRFVVGGALARRLRNSLHELFWRDL